MILNIQDINKIVEIEKSLHDDFSKGAFFKKCFEIINPKLQKYFKSDYLFHSLYYVETDFTLTPIHFEKLKSDANALFTTYIGLAEKAVSNKESKSFTEIILKENISGLVLYKASSITPIGDVINQSINSHKYLNSLANKLKVSSANINIIAAKYKLLAKEYGEDFFIHFIRPFASHKHYNGVLLLILKRQLTEEEYIELANIWTKVLSEPQIFEMSKASKLKILNTLNQELSHTWNNYFQSIKNIVQFDILPPAAIGDLEKLKSVRNSLLTNISAASKVQRFFTYLNKIGENLQNAEISQAIRDEMIKKDVDIKESITNILDSLLAFFSPDNIVITPEANAIKTTIEIFKQQPQIFIHANKTAIEIVLFNLLKNSLVHSPIDNKQLNIVLSKKGNYVMVEIINNGTIDKDWCDFINGKKDTIANIEYSFGIRTIKRILGIEYLKNNSLPMVVSAKNNFKSDSTNITFKLPVKHES